MSSLSVCHVNCRRVVLCRASYGNSLVQCSSNGQTYWLGRTGGIGRSVSKYNTSQLEGIFKQDILRPSPLHLATSSRSSRFLSMAAVERSSYRVAVRASPSAKKKKEKGEEYVHKLNRKGSATTTEEGDIFNAASRRSMPCTHHHVSSLSSSHFPCTHGVRTSLILP